MKEGYSNYAIAIQISEDERNRAKKKVKDLKRKFGVPRSEVLKMILLDFLDDEDIIEILKIKGGLKTKVINYRK